MCAAPAGRCRGSWSPGCWAPPTRCAGAWRGSRSTPPTRSRRWRRRRRANGAAAAAPGRRHRRAADRRLDPRLGREGRSRARHGRQRDACTSAASATCSAPPADERVGEALDRGEVLLDELQDAAIELRALPLSAITGPLPRYVRDLAASEGKQVALALHGVETQLDRMILDGLSDMLGHLLRNAIAHGIELPDERRAAGKPARGRVELRAEQRGGRVAIEVSDDGRGVAGELLHDAPEGGALADRLAAAGLLDRGPRRRRRRPRRRARCRQGARRVDRRRARGAQRGRARHDDHARLAAHARRPARAAGGARRPGLRRAGRARGGGRGGRADDVARRTRRRSCGATRRSRSATWRSRSAAPAARCPSARRR